MILPEGTQQHNDSQLCVVIPRDLCIAQPSSEELLLAVQKDFGARGLK